MNRAERRRQAREQAKALNNPPFMGRPERRGMEREQAKIPQTPPLSLNDSRGSASGECVHAWAMQQVVFSCGTPGSIQVCSKCGGIGRQCESCDGFHLPAQGMGGASVLPEKASREWVVAHGCPAEPIGEIPIRQVSMPPQFDCSLDTFATYGAECSHDIDDGSCNCEKDERVTWELVSFSG